MVVSPYKKSVFSMMFAENVYLLVCLYYPYKIQVL